MKINARAVFLCTLLALCIVLVLLINREARQDADLKTTAHRTAPNGDTTPPWRPADGTMWADKIEDPFTSAFLVAWLDLEANRRQREKAAAAAAKAAARPPKPAPGKSPPSAVTPQKAPPRFASVVYQGMIIGTDGSRVALVRMVDDGRQYTLKVGDPLFAVQVKEVTATHMVLTGEADAASRLEQGIAGRVRKD